MIIIKVQIDKTTSILSFHVCRTSENQAGKTADNNEAAFVHENQDTLEYDEIKGKFVLF